MAANDEIPRGLTQTVSVGASNTPIITFPAVVGIAWVLTLASLMIFQTTTDSEVITVNGIDFPEIVSQSSSGAWTGQVPFAPDTAVVVSTTGSGGTNRSATLQATAYAI